MGGTPRSPWLCQVCPAQPPPQLRWPEDLLLHTGRSPGGREGERDRERGTHEQAADADDSSSGCHGTEWLLGGDAVELVQHCQCRRRYLLRDSCGRHCRSQTVSPPVSPPDEN